MSQQATPELDAEFRDLVAQMRQAQKLFFQQRTLAHLRAAKELEFRVDQALGGFQANLFDRRGWRNL